MSILTGIGDFFAPGDAKRDTTNNSPTLEGQQERASLVDDQWWLDNFS